ncbi:uncharacterized protein LOC112523339 [Cynara cardunculus var. scolymus]|uniref:uncharacterized protein LOC112523339 n=1 Tax=Cynara cardunculus var. scolymus TaxID=59895 RepID=UPI000D628207|nr:uncharacterized protein LOC112523339 [Cynara cardunculus var. scolymus]
MGKWNYRRRWTPKNYYRDQRIPSPPTYYETEFKLRGAWENVDLPWEERFCISVGIPWKKVVNAKKYMHCYDNVVKWNDSASEETFRDAKERFWAKINGIPADVPQPDLDMYANDIDWNPEIDSELVEDLELAYFNPDDPENVEKFEAAKRNDDSLVPGCILGLDGKNTSNVDNPWERNKDTDINDKTNGWNCSGNFENKNTSDPWERGKNTRDDQDIKDVGWGIGGSSSWHNDAMRGGGSRNLADNNIPWGGGANNSWHQKQHPANFQRNGYGRQGWESGEGYRRAEHVSTSRGTQHTQAQRVGYRDNSFGHQRRNNGSGWESNISCRKREGSQQYTSSYKSARVQSDDYREGNQFPR